MKLNETNEKEEYIINSIETSDEELNSFLFSLGCYSGEDIYVIRHNVSGTIVSIKDARYNINNDLTKVIDVKTKVKKL